MKLSMSFCTVTLETLALTQKIQTWIAARQAEGWQVNFSIHHEDKLTGVRWQCDNHKDGQYREFTPCIDMWGNEHFAN